MKASFAGSAKARIAQHAAPITAALESTLEYVAEFADSPVGVDFRGVTVAATREGDGLVAILRVGIQNLVDVPPEWGVTEAGNYVLYGYGDTLPAALAALEASLRCGEARLTWDKYGNDAQKALQRPKKARRTDSKGNPR